MERESNPNEKEVENDNKNINMIDILLKKTEKAKLFKLILFLFLLSIIGLFSFYASYYFSSSDYTYPKYVFPLLHNHNLYTLEIYF